MPDTLDPPQLLDVQVQELTSSLLLVADHRLRGIDDGADLPKELLESFYASIRQEPFKFPVDDGADTMHTFFNPDREVCVFSTFLLDGTEAP